jgi:hypothetical protein
MKLVGLILVAGAAFAQTTRYPGAVDSDSSLFVVSDNVQTTLNAAMSTSDTAAVLASATGFVPNMIATICDTTTNTGKCTAWEHMLVTAVAGNVLTVTRGFAGTSARTHSSGRLVSVLIDSAHQKVLKDSVVAIETALGPNLGNVAPSPLVNASTFNFGTYSCNSSSVCVPGGPSGMSLIGGNNTLTMQPVPPGVNGSNTGHRLWVSGGTGAADACLITGGGGTSGQASGTIIINCANTHSGAWTIQSATSGISEAVSSLGGAGGEVYLSPRTYTVHASIVLKSNQTLRGAGDGSVIFLPNGAWPLTSGSGPFWISPPNILAILAAWDATGVRFDSFKIDFNGANNQNTAALIAGEIVLANCTRSTINNITFANSTALSVQDLNGAAVGEPNNAADNIISNNRSLHISNGANCGGGFFTQAARTKIIYNYTNGACDDSYVANATMATGTLFQGNTYDGGRSTLTGIAYHAEGSTHTTFSENTCVGLVSACYKVDPDNSDGITYIQMVNNQCGPDSLGRVPGTCVHVNNQTLTWAAHDILIANNLMRGCTAAGVLLETNTALNPSMYGVVVSGNTINNCVNAVMADVNAANIAQITVTGNSFVGNTRDINGLQAANAYIASGNVSYNNTNTQLPTGTAVSASHFHAGCLGILTASQTAFLNVTPPVGCASLSTNVTAQVTTLAETLGSARNLRVSFLNPVPANSTVTVLINGTATVLTCTVASAGASCTDITHQALINPGDQFAVQITTGAGTYGPGGVLVSFQY